MFKTEITAKCEDCQETITLEWNKGYHPSKGVVTLSLRKNGWAVSPTHCKCPDHARKNKTQAK